MKLLLDEDLSPIIASILRDRGLDALSVHEIGRAGLADQEQLEYAASEGRCFVTRNRNDHIILTRQFFSRGAPHKGVLIISSSHRPNDFMGIAQGILSYLTAWKENPTDYLFDFI